MIRLQSDIFGLAEIGRCVGKTIAELLVESIFPYPITAREPAVSSHTVCRINFNTMLIHTFKSLVESSARFNRLAMLLDFNSVMMMLRQELCHFFLGTEKSRVFVARFSEMESRRTIPNGSSKRQSCPVVQTS